MNRLVDRGKVLWERWQASRPGRTLERYDERNGSLLCGGMAYAALFSLFAALAIGYTILMRVLGGNPTLRDAVLDEVDLWVPGLVDRGGGGALEPEDLMVTTALSVTSVVAVLVLLFSATGFMGALRTAIRAMFDLGDETPNPVVTRLVQLAGFLLLGVAVLTSAGLSVAVSSLTPLLLDLVGVPDSVSTVTVRVLGLLVGLVLDALVVLGVLRLVGGVRPPSRELLLGSLSVAVVAGGLRYLGTAAIVGVASRNALLGSFVVVATVLVLVNFLGRVLLLACAWMAEHSAEIVPSSDEPTTSAG
ncbi:YihY/virulence factor BrkB family protein [Antribacter gilvus]|uniref:YihY/virulence factor BrkB family protein n=1 Tax=Antribacter gilvus TaxID=2304675 RepID=UPI001F0C3203|nr:YihY/virulence factor BrkB family protein [Antribacter gilvus]